MFERYVVYQGTRQSYNKYLDSLRTEIGARSLFKKCIINSFRPYISTIQTKR